MSENQEDNLEKALVPEEEDAAEETEKVEKPKKVKKEETLEQPVWASVLTVLFLPTGRISVLAIYRASFPDRIGTDHGAGPSYPEKKSPYDLLRSDHKYIDGHLYSAVYLFPDLRYDLRLGFDRGRRCRRGRRVFQRRKIRDH